MREFGLVEVDKQSKRNIEKFHIAQQLSLVDWEDLFHRFDFYEHAIFDKNIKFERIFSREILVPHRDNFLAARFATAQFEFFDEAPLVDRLQQPGPLIAMDFDGSTDDAFR